MKIYFITSNRHKLSEARTKLEPEGITVDQLKINYPEIQADTNEEIMEFGIEWINANYATEIDRPFIIEDSGLFVHALSNFPGVYSKFIYFTIGPQGILELLSDRTKISDRGAHFEACIAYFSPELRRAGEPPLIFKCECQGTITPEIRGTNGFGFDPIFMPEGADQTFGEMAMTDKNRYSHRSKVMEKLLEYLIKKFKIH